MKKIVILIFNLVLFSISYSKITVSIFEPIRFKYFNTRTLGSDKIVGEGIIQISTDDKENDIGKKIVIDFPKSGLKTNRKKWIKVEKNHVELLNKSMIISQEIEHIKVYAVLDKRDIDKGEEANIIEGRYEGYVPIIVSQYGKLPKSIPMIPIQPIEPVDKPTILPELPDENIEKEVS